MPHRLPVLAMAVLMVPGAHAAGVRVRFNPYVAEVGPFPSDVLTVADRTQKTGRRVNLPRPDCRAEPSTCVEIGLLNQYDGFSLLPRLRLRFSGPIKLHNLREGIYLVALDNLTGEEHGLNQPGDFIGVNEVVWDPATYTVWAKAEAVLDQHRRYGLVVSDIIRDEADDGVEPDPAFRDCVERPGRDEYCVALSQMVNEQQPRFSTRRIVAASIFTTLSATAWLEKARVRIQGAPIGLQSAAPRGLFNITELASVTVRLQRGANPVRWEEASVPLLLLAGVGRLAFGSYRSPVFLNEMLVIPTTATGQDAATPAVAEEIAFNAYLPAQAAPAGGYPVIIVGHGLGDHRMSSPTALAGTFASAGFATIAINAFGHGLGPEGRIVVRERSGRESEIPFGGRSLDVNGDGTFDRFEGCLAVGGLVTAGFRDCARQTALDLMQLVRAIRSGMDLDGDQVADLSRERIYYAGQSFGAMYGTLFAAVEPAVPAAVLNSGGATVADIAYRTQALRSLPVAMLGLRTPPLLNRGRDFEADYPLRYEETRVVRIPGALQIQEFFERMDWLWMPGDAVAYAPHLASSTLPGVPVKRVMFQVAVGDRTVPNPAQSVLIRAANLREMTSNYRHDLARAVAAQLAEDPHSFLFPLGPPAGLAVSSAAQRQIVEFLAGDGSSLPDVNGLVRLVFGRDLFEIPAVLTEDLNW